MRLMITIRHVPLPGGMHARAETQGRRVVLFLAPGLSPEQRWAALRRVRQAGRVGRGPRLPWGAVVAALAQDRARATALAAGRAARRHPVGSALVATLVAALFGYAVAGPAGQALNVPQIPGFPVVVPRQLALPSGPPSRAGVRATGPPRPRARRPQPSPASGGAPPSASPGSVPASPGAVPASPRRSAPASPAGASPSAASPRPASSAASAAPSPTPSPAPSRSCQARLLGLCLMR